MSRRQWAIVAAVFVLSFGVLTVANAQTSPSSYPGSDLTCTNATSGDGWITLAAKVGAPSGVALANQEGGNLNTPVRLGQRVCWAPSPVVTPPPTTAPPTTAPPTTQPPTTSTTTTTLPPTTTTAPPATTTPTTTTAPTTTAPTTTQPPATGGDFIEPFNGNGGLERFDTNVWHRDGLPVGGTVSADHDMACGNPATQRVVHSETPSESFYNCVDHLMVAFGDWSGYSVGWFKPKATFTDQTRVSWDVNVTNLLARQWWEVMIVPASFNSGFAGCRYCAVQSWLSPDPAHLPAYPSSAIVVGNGAFGNTVNIHAGGQDRYSGWQHTCGDPWDLFESSGACASKATRLPFSITENPNGTISVNYGGQHVETFAGQFPSEFVVIFKNHGYTPDKDGQPAGHTWHWDNINVS